MTIIPESEIDRFIRIAMLECDRDPIRDTDEVNGKMVVCKVCGKPRRRVETFYGKSFMCVVSCDCDIKKAEDERKQAAFRAKMEQIQGLKVASMMDRRFYEATFDNFKITKDNQKNFEACKRYVNKFDRMFENNQGLLFCGECGTGKSFTAACIANALMEELHTVQITSFVRILQSFDKFEGKERIYLALMQPELLIIDDLGAERSTDYALEIVYNIIDRRYREYKPIILTTNLTVEEMKQNTDLRYIRIYDRVFEMCYPMMFKGVSQRKIAAKERFDITKKLLEED